MNRFELYRFEHPDGSAKDWAYCDQGDGTALIRWGPGNQLRSQQEKPLAVALQRAREKRQKGYRHLGQISLDDKGRQVPPSAAIKAPQPETDPAPTAVSRTALLGPGNGFYF
ncbi:MAG: hypothetical protein K9L32_08655 [Chromatiaceae bacterium]|nr:hypothetical protein [Chromatiaceae bacterium]